MPSGHRLIYADTLFRKPERRLAATVDALKFEPKVAADYERLFRSPEPAK